MSLKPQPLNANLFYGKVIATYPEARVIDVKWPNLDVIKRSVVVVQGSENYSFPKVDEVGLVIGNDVERYYYLGKIEFAYNRRLAGEDKNPATGKKWPLSLIDAGEVYLLNILTGVGLRFSNSGDFSLKNQRDGLKYILEKAGNPLRWLTLAAKAVTLTSKTTELNVGAVIRSVPVLGNAVIKGVIDKTKAAQEFLVKVTQIVGVAQVDKARLHLGDILVEPIASAMGAIPKLHTEIASLGGVPAPLRANLAVCNEALGGTEIASVKMDQAGNLSINATAVGGTGSVFIHGDTKVFMGGSLTQVSIDGLPAAGILLGPVTGTTHPAVFGDLFTIWANSHQHPFSAGFIAYFAAATAALNLIVTGSPADMLLYKEAMLAAISTFAATIYPSTVAIPQVTPAMLSSKIMQS